MQGVRTGQENQGENKFFTIVKESHGKSENLD